MQNPPRTLSVVGEHRLPAGMAAAVPSVSYRHARTLPDHRDASATNNRSDLLAPLNPEQPVASALLRRRPSCARGHPSRLGASRLTAIGWQYGLPRAATARRAARGQDDDSATTAMSHRETPYSSATTIRAAIPLKRPSSSKVEPGSSAVKRTTSMSSAMVISS